MIDLPRPQPPEGDDPDHALALRMLYEEQARLRAELDNLRRQQDEQGSQDKGEEKKDEKQDGQDGDKKDGEGEEGKDKKEKKPSLKQRAGAWAHAHPLGTVLVVAGVVVLIIGCVLLWNYLESYENTDDAFVDGHTDPISARISGYVTHVYVENTYRVKKGEVLVQLDPRDYLVAKEQSTAALAQAQAGLRAQAPNVPITATSQSTQVQNARLSVESASANLVAAQERYRSALADLHQAQATQANAEREENRYKLLVAKEEVSRELYDQRATEAKTQSELVASREETANAAEKAVTQAEAELRQAEQQAKEAEQNSPRQVAIQNATVQMRKAELLTAKARADQAVLNLQYTQITAPADGIIGDRAVQVGGQVQPGQEMLALTETNNLWVTANFKETQVQRMKAGQAVTIHVDALKQNFDGYVEALPGASGAVYSLLPPENATGNYVKVVQRLPVRIRFKPNQPGAERLAPGMSVEPKVWLK